MKIIDAVWEKRNLGVSVQEISVDTQDNLDDFKKAIKELTSQYSVIKFPSNKIDFIWVAEENGFRFVETQLVFTGNIKQLIPEAEKILSRNKNITVETDNSPEMYEFVATKIKEGIFFTDRIALDPYFNCELSNKRYANWLLDMKNNNKSNLQIMKKGNDIFAFSLNKFDGSDSLGLIGGIFKEFQKEPLGLYWEAAIIKNLSEIVGIKNLKAPVSSNNYSVIKVCEYFGMQVSSISSVFVRHS